MKRYNSYHTTLKQLARQDRLPEKYSSCIDRSTIWRWKKESDEKYLGMELSNAAILEQFLSRPESASVIKTYLKIAYSISRILNNTEHFQKALKENMDMFVRTILKYQKSIKLKIIFRLCGISSSVFYHWKNQVLYACNTSPSKLCRRIYPNQLTGGEINKMKVLLNDHQYRYWPINSIAYYALRNNIVSTSLATWYNYSRKLGIKRPKTKKKKGYPTGIRASRPHQVWHADITVVKCLNGMKCYVYLLMDNYSRAILNYQVSERVSAKIRLESIREAYDQYGRDTTEKVSLIVDGGVENNNNSMDLLINRDEVCIQKLIAGKDIQFSNSMVEAQNKIIKYNYLFKHPCNDIHDLRKLLSWIIPDYQYHRPHHSLKGLTPFEALSGTPLPKIHWQQQIKEAQKARLLENAKEDCEICNIKD